MASAPGKLNPRITVIGVGGAGGNVVNNMIAAGLANVKFVVANTDMQALASSKAETRIQLGENLTEGLGAGSDPEIGEAAAEEAAEEIRTAIAESHMLFIAAGMGGGTGTGAAYVVAREARDSGILSIAVVTKPFQFEGAKRLRNAEAGINELRKYADTLLVIPNENLFRIATDRTTFADAFVMADQVMYSGIVTITDLIMKEGLINLDLADVKAVLGGMGRAMMGMGEASGEQRAIAAAEEAIVNPLLDEVTLKGAKSLLLCITGGRDMTLWEVEEAASRVCQEVDPDANIIVGATFDDGLGDRIRVSIVASGMPRVVVPEPTRDGELPVWTPRSQREPGVDLYGRRLGEGEVETQRVPARGRARTRRTAGEGDPAGDGLTDGLSALPKTPGRARKGGGRKQGETGPKRGPALPDGVELGDARRRATRRAVDGSLPPPVNWRELTAPDTEHPRSPPQPVNWRERMAAAEERTSEDADFDGSIVPERDPDPAPRKPGFFERLGFGRRRA
ncbi:MAG TPA: cell division protein FtsZ [Hyphomicrobiaceae bacterium]|nr:cell division protein FtsZ [Hyphomicrobiaceae bacterium]